MRSRIATLSLCLVLALPSAAQARSHHHARHHAARAARPVVSPPSRFAGLFGNGGAAGDHGAAVVDEARRWIGTNPTGKARLWCASFMNFVLRRVGIRGTGSDSARSFLRFPHVVGPKTGEIAVLARRGGGHVGVVSGVTAAGDPIIISGNHGHTTGEGVYSRSRVIAYVAASPAAP